MDGEKEPNRTVPALRTLKTDADKYAARTKPSYIESAALELKAKRAKEAADAPHNKGLRGLIITAIILIATLAIAGIYFLFFKPQPPPQPHKYPPPPESLILPDRKETIRFKDLNPTNLSTELTNRLLSPSSEGFFTAYTLVEATSTDDVYIDLKLFIKTAELRLPAKLANSINGYTLGIFNQNGQNHPFLIFKISSFSDALAGTLEWEANMPADLRVLFANIPQLNPTNEIFSDLVVQNQNARVLNFGNTSVLAYAFYNLNYLILSDSSGTLASVVKRYAVFPPK